MRFVAAIGVFMKNMSLFFLVVLVLFHLEAFALTAPPLAETYISKSNPSANYSSSPNLSVNNDTISLIRFNLAGLPSNAPQISQATLLLFVNQLNAAGTVDIFPVTSLWAGNTVTYSSRPIIGKTPIASNIAVLGSNFVVVDVTNLVKQWAVNQSSNFGIAIVPSAGSAVSALFDNRRNTATSHEPRLQIDVTAKTFSVCVSPSISEINNVCKCNGGRIVSMTGGYGTCTATSDTGSCSASGINNIAGGSVTGSCCVCTTN